MDHENQPWWCHGSLYQYRKVISSSSCSSHCTVYHMLDSISNLPQDWLGCSCYLSENRLPTSVKNKIPLEISSIFIRLFVTEPSSGGRHNVPSALRHHILTDNVELWRGRTHPLYGLKTDHHSVILKVFIWHLAANSDILAHACNPKQLNNCSNQEPQATATLHRAYMGLKPQTFT